MRHLGVLASVRNTRHSIPARHHHHHHHHQKQLQHRRPLLQSGAALGSSVKTCASGWPGDVHGNAPSSHLNTSQRSNRRPRAASGLPKNPRVRTITLLRPTTPLPRASVLTTAVEPFPSKPVPERSPWLAREDQQPSLRRLSGQRAPLLGANLAVTVAVPVTGRCSSDRTTHDMQSM